ncbi:6-phosphogluconate dehydrogenase [Altererythrobacter sp. B11]|uniref:NAD(P)-dependent oxidoreductase n=1 Tax=Altererythrobacter sp. B11 TaxID=2060312 RepID=UPI000DC6E110|nr:NAD(P)-dependent oxidoreductase [Altererythrobacter sp. B11]BBC73867.1 6-phosphogluconate dehydrogenase [Altererythrobacter sp. B11]
MASIAVIGAGAMGSAIGWRLASSGCTVPTLLEGRSRATRDRAAAAGMVEASLDEVGAADLILSIVPPAQAEGVVEQLAPLFARPDAPLFCDANALSPQAKRGLCEQVVQLGGHAVDGCIIGGPPSETYSGPHLYLCGDRAGEVAALLGAHGLDCRLLAGEIGAAAALKTCYGGINKGIIGLTTAMLLAAQRHGAAEDLRREMEESLGWLLERQRKAIPAMYPKAYRWDSEMAGIADFLEAEDPAAAQIWEGLARFFTDRAAAQDRGEELEALRQLLA